MFHGLVEHVFFGFVTHDFFLKVSDQVEDSAENFSMVVCEKVFESFLEDFRRGQRGEK